MSRFLDFVDDENSYADYLVRRFRNDPSMLRKSLADELEKRGLPETMLETILEVSTPLLPALIEQLKPTLRLFARYLRSELPSKLRNAAKSGHIRALKKGASPEVKIRLYKDLQYAVADVRESALILGDSSILFHVEGSKPYKAFIEKDDVLNAVVLPLTASKLLVGSCEGFIVSEHNWPEAIARCSLEYFIANDNSDINRHLQGSIAEDAAPLTREELEEIITEVMNQ